MQRHTVPLAPVFLAGVICWAPGLAGAQASSPPTATAVQPAPLLESREFVIRVLGWRPGDAAALEFDVYCPNGQLVIDHQFGTEEYDEYVGDFNDAFAVFVDGVPVSLLPDCSDIVGVQSVNLDTNRHLYLHKTEDIADMVDPAYSTTKVEYDGLTLRLRANALVTPGQTHRVRIVIADVNDARLDAAVFLEKDSLKSIQPQP